MRPLASTDKLADGLGSVRLLDIRWALADTSYGADAHERGHIPGAVFVDLDTDLCGATGTGRHPLPMPTAFGVTLGRLGVGATDRVVIYDDNQGQTAARMWWMLNSIGHDHVQVLDGGYTKWIKERRPIETGAVRPVKTNYPEPSHFDGLVSIEELTGRHLIDSRAAERYRGEVEPVDPKAGHIPGAINLPTADNLSDDGVLLGEAELAARFESVGDDPVVSCGSGVTACHNALAMVVAGLEMPDLYVGSFSEWSRLDLPVATGDAP